MSTNDLLTISAEDFVSATNELIKTPPPSMFGIQYPYVCVELKGKLRGQSDVYRSVPLDAVELTDGKLHITGSDYVDGREEPLKLEFEAADCTFEKSQNGRLFQVENGGATYAICPCWSWRVPYNGVYGEDRFRPKREEEAQGKGDAR